MNATDISKKITRSEVFHAVTALSAIIFTTWSIISFHYSIKVNKLILKEKNKWLENALVTGTIVKTELNDVFRHTRHFGIVIIEDGKKFVIHNTPYKTNAYGGSLIIEEFSQFKKDQRILETEKTAIAKDLILKTYEKHKRKKFNFLTFNCEGFINKIRYGDSMSNQVRTGGLIAIGALTIVNILLWRSR